MPRRGRRWLWILLLIAFVVIPLVEIYALIQVGKVIGVWWTLFLLVLDSLIGGWLIRREGGRAWTALRTALSTGRMPAKEIADGALILIGGTLMLAPGFVTDALGVALILPFTRPIARGILARTIQRRLIPAPGTGATTYNTRPGSAGEDVVRGEVVDD